MANPCLALFSPIEYDFLYQRPQALADTLAERGVRVLYFEPPRRQGSLNNSRLRYGAAHLVRSIRPNLSVIPVSRYFNFLGVPFRFSRPSMERHIQKWIGAALRELCPEGAVAFVESPVWWRYLRGNRFNQILYDCIDHDEVLSSSIGTEPFERLRRDLIDHSDILFATAAEIEDSLAELSPRRRVIRLPNAAFVEPFAAASPAPSVTALRQRFRAIAGYVGVLARWTDVAMIQHCAESCPDIAFVLVGPWYDGVEVGLQQRRNVFLLGRQPHADIPGYIHSFDVCLNPFVSGAIAASTNPIKLYEYLAAGKPVVSTPIRELQSFGDLVYSAATPAQFVALLRRIIEASEASALVARRQAFARDNSWSRRVDVILENLGAAT